MVVIKQLTLYSVHAHTYYINLRLLDDDIDINDDYEIRVEASSLPRLIAVTYGAAGWHEAVVNELVVSTSKQMRTYSMSVKECNNCTTTDFHLNKV